FSIDSVWKSVRYGISNGMDTAYWGFLGVGTTHGYAVSSLMDTAYWYCPPSKTAKQLEEIRNFKQEGDKTLYQAWEQYNDLLYKCPTHDINNHQKTMANHSQKWHDGSSNRKIESSSSSEGITAIVNKLENLGQDMKKLKENVQLFK
ncbi:hypothetical protein Tco_1371941, partial [Tanacetum coccineum]